MEAGIILDRSGSVANYGTNPPIPISIDNWHTTVDFTIQFLRAFGVNPYNVHFGLMRFSNVPINDVSINNRNYWSNSNLEAKLRNPSIYDKMPYGELYFKDINHSAYNNTPRFLLKIEIICF